MTILEIIKNGGRKDLERFLYEAFDNPGVTYIFADYVMMNHCFDIDETCPHYNYKNKCCMWQTDKLKMPGKKFRDYCPNYLKNKVDMINILTDWFDTEIED